ncbi:MAG: glycerophosphodiester phosphodiesterase [Pseudobdellovibrio sp.]
MKLMGHRGARDRAPENTMRSFQALLDSGLAVVEFDIHESIDGVWVVHHDDTLDRTTTSKGFLKDKNWRELSTVKTPEGDSLPQLTNVLNLFKDTEVELQIEIKSSGDLKKLGELLKNHIDVQRITMISFNHKWLLDFKLIFPDIKTSCLFFGLPLDPVSIVRVAQADGLSLSVNWTDEELVKKCKAEGLTVTAWNANDEPTFLKMRSIGVDYLGTDVPYQAIKWG